MITSLPIDDIAIALQDPERLVQPTAWVGHIPFAFWLVSAIQPGVYVELGVHSGNSYCAVCQEVKRLGLPTACFAVDTWQGDEQAGLYSWDVLADLQAHHDPRYGSFSRLVQSTFVQALDYFADGSIDLLHIDGFHTYEAVRDDFEHWRPKLSKHAIVLFHDINVREREFGVWRFWEEISRSKPHFTFLHSHGLGVVAMGEVSEKLEALFTYDAARTAAVRLFFGTAGNRLARLGGLQGEVDHLKIVVGQQNANLVHLKNQNESLTKQISSDALLQNEVDQLKVVIGRQHTDILNLTSENDSLTQQILRDDALRSHLLKIKSEIVDSQQILVSREIKQLETDKALLSAELASLASEHNKQRAASESLLDTFISERDLRETEDARTRHMASEVTRRQADEIQALQQRIAQLASKNRGLTRKTLFAERTAEQLARDCVAAWDRLAILAGQHGVQVADRALVTVRSPLKLDPETYFPISATEVLLDRVEQGDPLGYANPYCPTEGLRTVLVGQDGRYSVTDIDHAIRNAEGDIVVLRSVGDKVAGSWLPGLLDLFRRHALTFGVGGLVLGRDGRVAWSGLQASDNGLLMLWDAGLSPDDDRLASASLVPLLAPGLVAFARDLYVEIGGLDLARFDLAEALIDLSIRAREAGYALRRAPGAVVRLEQLPGRTAGELARVGLPIDLRSRYKVLAARRRPRLLIVYPTALRWDNDAGSLDAYWCLRIFQSLGYDITFVSMYQPEDAGRYTDDLRAQGVDCPVAPQTPSAQFFIETRGRDFDVVLLYRVVVAAFLVDLIRYNAPDTKIIFHTVDLHFLREERQAEMLQSEELFDQASATKREELRCIQSCDASIVVSTLESRMLNELTPYARHYLVPIMHPAPGRLAPVEGRRGVIFVGGFSHQPNIDAVRYLCNEIWPLVRLLRPDEQLSIVGADVSDEIRSFHDPSQGVAIVGFVPDLAPFYKGMRVNVAPLRFGAGIKGKVLAAMMVGLPTVATDVAAEGMDATEGDDLLVGRTAEAFAEGIVALCEDDVLFQRISDAGLSFSQKNFSVDAQIPRMRRILNDLGLPH